MEKKPKYQQVAESLTGLIEKGVLCPGAAAPSVRRLSRQWQVSITTILKAYYLLEARGLLVSRPRSGFYVSSQPPSSPPEPALSNPEPEDQWEGQTGFPTDAAKPLLREPGEKEVYLCGNPLMINAAVKMLEEEGIPQDRVFYDKFG